MFHIKKEDYNSVQFMPDYSSSSIQANDRSGRRSGIFFAAAVLILVLIIAAVGAVYVYFTYFSPASRFIAAFEDGNYGLCQELSENNAFDSGFTAGIQDIVMSGSQAAVDSYKTGMISSSEASALLDTYDTATDGCFKDMIDQMRARIAEIDAIHTGISEAEDTIISGRYMDGIKLMMSVREAAAAINMDIDNDLADVVTENLINLKPALFNEFASKFRANDLDSISAYLDMITIYTDDPDYADMRSVLASVKSGDMTASQAAQTASSVVNDDEDEDEDEDEDISDGSEDTEDIED